MTYTEIYNRYWEFSSDAEREAFIESLDEASQKAWQIIRTLLYRKGFEYWWIENAGGMSSECNDDIFEQIRQIIAKGAVRE